MLFIDSQPNVVGAIVGGTVGGIAMCILIHICIVICCCALVKKRRKSPMLAESFRNGRSPLVVGNMPHIHRELPLDSTDRTHMRRELNESSNIPLEQKSDEVVSSTQSDADVRPPPPPYNPNLTPPTLTYAPPSIEDETSDGFRTKEPPPYDPNWETETTEV